MGRVLLAVMGSRAAPAGPYRQRVDRDGRAAAAHRRDADLPADRAALQAPAHRPGAAQRHVQAAAQRARPAAARRVQGRADRLRGSRRGRGARPRQDRGLHLEGLPRLHHVHRVRPLPVTVPGVEHRKAAVAQARDHEPARPHVRQGAIHPRRQGDARSRTPPRAGVGEDLVATKHDEEHHVPESGFERVPAARARSRPPVRWSAPPSSSASSTPTCCGPAPPAARASSSARWTSSTSTTSSTCAATR